MYKRTDLSNGLRVVSHTMKERDSISLGIWVGVGGRYEDERVKGAAHFLEHIVFKGSQKYSCSQIKELIEGVGGSLNAFTSEEQTCFYAKIPSKHLDVTFAVLSDMLLTPRISAVDVAKEKTVIAEEIKMYHDLPQYYVMELFDQLLWPGHPLGKFLAGTVESVMGISPADLKKFHRHYYTPDNLVVSACGKLGHEKVVRLAKRYLGRLKGTSPRLFIAADNSQQAPRCLFYKKATEQMHLALGTLGFDEKDTRRYALSLLSIILGGNMSSRLFNEVREKRGLAYSISSSTKSLHDTGVFMVRAGVDNRKLVDAVALILKELDKVRRLGVSLDEFRRAKDYLKGQLALGLEDTMDHMLWIGETTISRDKFISQSKIIRDIEKFTRDDVRDVAREVIQNSRYNLAIVGPVNDDQEKSLKSLLNVSA